MICVSYTRSRIKFGDAISIAEQNEKIAAFVKGRRMTIEQKYSDRKEDVEADEGFLEMKEAGINRQFDCIVFWSMMYFGNDPLIGYNLLLHTFIPAQIDFAVVCDNFTSVGKSVEEIEEYLSSKYKERRDAHGITTARYAASLRMNTLYGYERHGEEFTVDTAVKPVVDKIFKLALDGKSVSEIKRYLNDSGIESSHKYLTRIAGLEKTVSEKWENAEIKKILTDVRYKGVLITHRNGKEYQTSMEAYITDKEYEKIGTAFRKQASRPKTENPLTKRIYDYDSHIRLYMGDYLSDGGNYFYISKKPENYGEYRKKVIEVKIVFDEVLRLFSEESELAKRVLVSLKTESGRAEIEKQKSALQEKIDDTFSKLLEEVNRELDLTKSEIHSEVVNTLDAELSLLVRQKAELDVIFSESNPWIKLYANANPVTELTLQFAKQYISEIMIDKFEKVVFVPYENEWKQGLPSYWFEA